MHAEDSLVFGEAELLAVVAEVEVEEVVVAVLVSKQRYNYARLHRLHQRSMPRTPPIPVTSPPPTPLLDQHVVVCTIEAGDNTRRLLCIADALSLNLRNKINVILAVAQKGHSPHPPIANPLYHPPIPPQCRRNCLRPLCAKRLQRSLKRARRRSATSRRLLSFKSG